MTDAAPGPAAEAAPKSSVVRHIVDWGGPACFMVAFFAILARTHDSGQAIMYAPWGLVAGSVVAVILGFAVEKRVAPVPLGAAILGVVLGGLTLLLHDPVFVFLKPTIVNLALAGVLLFGLVQKKMFLKSLFSGSITMPEPAWRSLTVRYIGLFVVLALVNEAVWRTQTKTFWVVFHFIGPLVLTVLFSISQMPFIMKQAKALEAAAELEG
jgi:intracellular septation protein